MEQVTQLVNTKGNPVANHFVITTSEGQFLKSYDSVVAFIPNNRFNSKLLGTDWNKSATTLKHVKQFMGWSGYSKKDIEKHIDNLGARVEYDLAGLIK